MTPRIALAMGVGTVVGAMLISLVAFSSGTGVAAEYPTGELLAWIDDFDERLGLVEDQAVRIDERNASLRTVVGGLQVAALEADANSLSEAVSFLLVEQEQSALAQRQDRNRWRLVAQYAVLSNER